MDRTKFFVSVTPSFTEQNRSSDRYRTETDTIDLIYSAKC